MKTLDQINNISNERKQLRLLYKYGWISKRVYRLKLDTLEEEEMKYYDMHMDRRMSLTEAIIKNEEAKYIREAADGGMIPQ